MKQIYVDEAVNGYMLTVIWDEDKMVKEVYERKIDVFQALSRWLSKKVNEEAGIIKKSPMWEVI
jgi:hypothetical protein